MSRAFDEWQPCPKSHCVLLLLLCSLMEANLYCLTQNSHILVKAAIPPVGNMLKFTMQAAIILQYLCAAFQLHPTACLFHQADSFSLVDGLPWFLHYFCLMHCSFCCRFATPMRTPRAAAARGEDRLLAEAQNLARLQQGQTPLFGGDSGVHIEKGDFGDSLDPRAGQSVRATPSALAGMTPAGGQTGMRSIAGVPGTPSVAGTPLRTPGDSCLQGEGRLQLDMMSA